MIRLGVCGFGYWGPNLVRAFSNNPDFAMAGISDLSPRRRAKASQLYPAVTIYESGLDLVRSTTVDAVAIATPVQTHFELASEAIRQGKHVIVEKPLCSTSEEAQELVDLADRHCVALLVDHIYVFHDVVRKLKGMMQDGSLGTISYYDTIRINLGLFQPDVNVLWDLAPHDFSIMDYLFEEDPIHVEATGYCHLNPNLPDIVYVTAHYASRMIAHLNLSWMSPVKVRRTAVGGSRMMAVWDDLNPEERLKIFNSGIDVQQEEQREVIVPGYRIGDIYSPRMPGNEALSLVAAHVSDVIRSGGPSPIDGRAGLRIIRLLEASQKALEVSLAKSGTAGRSSPAQPR